MIIKNLFLILCSLLLITNCSSDDDSKSDSLQNEITYNSETYPIVAIKVLEVNNINGNNTFITGIIDQAEDEGFIIQLYGNTLSSVSGTYIIHNGDGFDPEIHCRMISNLPYSDLIITQGNVSVNIDGNTIAIEFEVGGSGTEASVIGHYKGSFIIQ